ncbi:MAG: hypothetical protein U5R31_11665 [Acidimicrobiia bacterium]|nr:hypothetical protein [Acidimicrobiia bacterium]
MADKTPTQLLEEIRELYDRAERLGSQSSRAEKAGDPEAADRYDAEAMRLIERIGDLQDEYTELTDVAVRMDGSTDLDTEVGPHTFEMPAKEVPEGGGHRPLDHDRRGAGGRSREDRGGGDRPRRGRVREPDPGVRGRGARGRREPAVARGVEKLIEANEGEAPGAPLQGLRARSRRRARRGRAEDGTKVVLDESEEVKEKLEEETPTRIPEDLADKIVPGDGSGSGAGGGPDGDGKGTGTAPPTSTPDDARHRRRRGGSIRQLGRRDRQRGLEADGERGTTRGRARRPAREHPALRRTRRLEWPGVGRQLGHLGATRQRYATVGGLRRGHADHGARGRRREHLGGTSSNTDTGTAAPGSGGTSPGTDGSSVAARRPPTPAAATSRAHRRAPRPSSGRPSTTRTAIRSWTAPTRWRWRPWCS